MSQPTWAQVEAGLVAAIKAATVGLTPAGSALVTFWRFQDVAQPDLDYVDLALGAAITIGSDYTQELGAPDWLPDTPYRVGARVLNDSLKTYQCTAPGTSAGAGGPTGTGGAIVDGGATWAYQPPGSEVSITVAGTREVSLSIQAWSASTVETIAKASAISILDGIVTRLQLPTARGAFAAVGVVPFDPGPVNYLPTIVRAGFRGRATCDVRCTMPARALVEYAAFIASFSGVATVDDGVGPPISVPFASG